MKNWLSPESGLAARAIEAGNRDKTWIERELQERGCEVIEDFYRQPEQ